jgi:predicted transport protein
MTLKAYLDNIQTQTGKTPQDFLALAEKKGLLKQGVKTGQIVSWLKEDFGLGQGHAMAIVLTLRQATEPRISKNDQIAKQFRGNKARWRNTYDNLLARVNEFGLDVSTSPNNTYISLLRKNKKFAIVQVTSNRLDISIKLKDVKFSHPFEPAGSWNSMVTHRVGIADPKQINAGIISWLHQAYEKA